MSTPEIPAGKWQLDPSHSEVGFSVRHLAVAKVKGQFESFEGTVTIADDPLQSSVEATIDLSSINTRDKQRDEHLRSGDFFNVEEEPKMTFRSTSVTPSGGDYKLVGDLTIRDVTKPVELDLEFNGIGPDPWGGTRAGFSAAGEINRKDFGIDFNIPLDGGGFVIGDKIKLVIEAEAALQTD